MNENTKTIAFWGAALVMMAIGAFVAWPTAAKNELGQVAGQPLFNEFKDPLSAANMKIVTYDADQAKLSPFEVRKDSESGVWTIPSRSGYPADAVEQMKDAANAFVGLKILDIQTENAEDHDDLGVLEPKLEDLQGGEEGVGRLVTFKDDGQKTLASLIIGNPVKDEEGKIYVRKPGEDPVYVVKMDDSTLTTKFQDWIEEDLLQLSSIEVQQVQIKDYSASLAGMGNQISWERNYEATVSTQGTDWTVDEFLVYDNPDPMAEPKPGAIPDGKVANKEKLDEMKDALDDLKIVDVVRKPEGMSASLKADDKLVSDEEAYRSLLVRGFFPLDEEMISANGELMVALTDGVQYVLRFGNVKGVSEAEETDESDVEDAEGVAVGVNRYMLLTTKVDESQFPAPALEEVPKNLDDLEKLMTPPEEPADEAPAADEPADDPPADGEPADGEPADGEPVDGEPVADESAEMKPADEAEVATETESEDNPEDAPEEVVSEVEPAQPDASGEGEAVVEGEGESAGSGGGFQQDGDEAAETVDEQTPADSDDADAEPQPAESVDDKDDAADTNTEVAEEEEDVVTYAEMTEEEKLELLEAEQEKITKANQRLLDARKEKMEDARRRVRELNERFADWYYVIPEATYRKLRIDRDELFVSVDADDESGSLPPMPSGPSFGMPGLPPGN